MTLRMLKIWLLVAALMGLAGEATAIAAAQPIVREAPAAAMSDDCMKMMAGHEDENAPPCDGSFKCMLAMGCLSVNVLPEAGAQANGETSLSAPGYWPAVSALQGTSDPPETDPPTRLG